MQFIRFLRRGILREFKGKSRENTIKVKQIEFMEREHGMRKQKLDDWDGYELEW